MSAYGEERMLIRRARELTRLIASEKDDLAKDILRDELIAIEEDIIGVRQADSMDDDFDEDDYE